MFQHSANDIAFLKAAETEDCRFTLPGYGRPLDFAPSEKNIYGVWSRSMFPSALDDRDIQHGFADQPCQTLRELAMVRIMEELTDIPEWWKKVYEQGVAEQWKRRALNGDEDITPNIANWIIEELKFKAMIYEASQAVGLYNGDITKSDTNIPNELIEELKSVTKVLEYENPELRFYHPGSMKKQRDLLSTALYPLMYGKSRILPNKLIGLDDALEHTGQGEVIPVPQETGITREDIAWRVSSRADIQVRPYSRYFQLLPSDWRLGKDGRWHIATYINNLHPVKHRNVYKTLEKVFNCMISQWNMTLTPLKDMLHSRNRIEYHKVEYHPVPDEVKALEPQIQPHESQADFEERLEKWRMHHYRAVQPDVDQFLPWAVPPSMISKLPEDLPNVVRIEQAVEVNQDYKERGLQVITRIMGVDINPDEPYYDTEWHVEGQMNEHICAAGFVFYDSDNIEAPFMEFRNIVATDTMAEIEHEPHDFVWVKQIFGLENGEPAIQHSGSIKCNEGRAIIFPSTVQHRIRGFELKDKSRPGYCRILTFYLIDPNIRIISTANIPPQRFDWTLDVKEEGGDLTTAMAKLALDNRDKKGSLPMSLTEALEARYGMLKDLAEFMRYQRVAFESRILML